LSAYFYTLFAQVSGELAENMLLSFPFLHIQLSGTRCAHKQRGVCNSLWVSCKRRAYIIYCRSLCSCFSPLCATNTILQGRSQRKSPLRVGAAPDAPQTHTHNKILCSWCSSLRLARVASRMTFSPEIVSKHEKTHVRARQLFLSLSPFVVILFFAWEKSHEIKLITGSYTKAHRYEMPAADAAMRFVYNSEQCVGTGSLLA